MNNQKAKKILVVGASGGIGNSVTELLLANGCNVIGTYYKNSVQIEKFSNTKNFTRFQLDLKSTDSFKLLQQFIQDENQQLYAVVNCSGIVKFEAQDLKNDLDIWNETISVNLTGNFLLAKYFYKYLQNNGRFIMISSTDAYFGGTITSSYAVSKSGINSLTKSLSLLFQDKKIRVNAIAPGWVMTPMTAVNGQVFLDTVAKINPLGRNAIPEDVANFIDFLLSDKSNYINGQVISLDGGYTNQDPTLILEEKTQINGL